MFAKEMITSWAKMYSAFTIIVFMFTNELCVALDAPNPNSTQTKAHILPPCQACKTLVNSFKEGMTRTARGKFEGGDADWEEKKLRSYSNSEVRLVEIQEKLCSGVIKGENQCHNLAESHESSIEEWFLNHQKEIPDLHDWLCIQKLKVCCPDHHFGPNCSPCPGHPDGECSLNGKCKGSGTRKGNGHCVCDKGYTGDLCQLCAAAFYESYKDEKKILCSPCHKSCKDSCTQAGPKGCLACNDGWFMDAELGGCHDVDECVINKSVCPSNTFCVNSPGSHTCINCDKACKSCNADGPDNCIECTDGYSYKDGTCVEPENDVEPGGSETIAQKTEL